MSFLSFQAWFINWCHGSTWVVAGDEHNLAAMLNVGDNLFFTRVRLYGRIFGILCYKMCPSYAHCRRKLREGWLGRYYQRAMKSSSVSMLSNKCLHANHKKVTCKASSFLVMYLRDTIIYLFFLDFFLVFNRCTKTGMLLRNSCVEPRKQDSRPLHWLWILLALGAESRISRTGLVPKFYHRLARGLRLQYFNWVRIIL